MKNRPNELEFEDTDFMTITPLSPELAAEIANDVTKNLRAELEKILDSRDVWKDEFQRMAAMHERVYDENKILKARIAKLEGK